MSRTQNRILFLLSIGLFITSLGVPAFTLTRELQDWGIGWGLLVMGWLGGEISWYANPFYTLAVFSLILKKWDIATCLSGFALLLSLSFLRFPSILINEGGGRAEIAQLSIGYFFSVGAIFLLALISGMNWRKELS